ncbi:MULTISPECIES: PucR family transcriptional regulator ligand-binding domain-containing protein [unclassified Streptomyces]|uniref:PucR family transcriptional regulator n=1 Tax=unclassified Streptomyces TaxID=2593676 RepID=UPI002DDC3ABF|nr:MULTISPECIES: PucR family transcriptional regulator ligand-binding domain-containing protein [unclassified Streptomyces]WSA90199.1 PucR family transcriptional regulator ligand-binding domain-containing protein [Streptomyces sp. NBC_01795]WSB74426.1 PucR family transcriptional regulator ligand-binding domain-containing protein [Streptomyces sp. NBC_01775]WSS17191.1 PucR family transcriptional regulator ligand-binding domain-containing protein [Streptomyces sp. NBC_01186]WSS45936.1 PucR family
MQPTVREVLQLSALATGRPRVVGGRDHLDHPVRWVHSSDLPDLTDLLEGGELVLTTGPTLANGAPRAEAYLSMLAAQGVAGLVIELGTHLTAVPEHLGAFADSLSLPVVTLTERTRFVEVTQQVHRLIVADQYEEVEFARTTHEVFTSLNMSRASTTDIVTRAAQTLGAPLVLEDLSRHVLAFCALDTSTTALLDQWADRSRLHDAAAGHADAPAWSAVPVGVGSERWGRLVLPTQASDPSRARMVLERAAQSLQLHRMIQQERDALVVQALGGLLDDLLSARFNEGDDEKEAMARATALGLTPSSRYAPLSVRIPQRPGTDALAQGEADRRLLTAVRQSAAAVGGSAIASIRREGTVSAIISCLPKGADRTLDAVCRGLRDRLTGRSGTEGWAAGTAPASASLIGAAHGLTEAEHVADVGLTMPEAHRLYRSTDVRLRGLVALLRGDHRLQAFAETELGRLLDHDARTGENLLALLRTHLDCSGSKTHTARLTGLSRPTLYSRLRTLERILGVSLESAESRTSLHTALMIIDAR